MDRYPILEVHLWYPSDSISTRNILNWVQTAPAGDLIGFIQIGRQKPHQITHNNRRIWEDILFDVYKEMEDE